jgi:hypothetical protein
MSCYISSNNNRVYVALESTYGSAAAVTGQNRIPLLKLGAKQVLEQLQRKDKTGTRTFVGLPNRIRKKTSFQLSTLMTEWVNQSSAPSHGPLFQAAMGATPLLFTGGTVAAITNQTQIQFGAVHGLTAGQAIMCGGELRFVAGVLNTTTVVVSAPFANATVGSAVGPAMTYKLSTGVGSATIYDYWDPSTVVQRVLNGVAIDVLKVKVNGDYQEFEFSGQAQDLLDSASFTSGQGGLTQFPVEPTLAGFDYTVVPGHLGEVWMGTSQAQFHTLTAAELTLENNLALRVKEFGSDFARCIAGGQRNVNLGFTLFEQDDAQTRQLYQAARQRSPIGVMLQLGAQAGQLFGAYMPAMVPEVPEFDDGETRLEWKFQSSRGQGTADDELYVAFG